MRASRTLVATLVLLSTAGIAACGSDAKTSPASSETDAPSASRLCDAPKADGKPTLSLPAAAATQLRIVDDKVGTGEAVGPSSDVTVNYIGCGQISGKQFDSSWDRGTPATFNVNRVIKGWTDGLQGMKVGGRRTLTIPGALAYGENPSSPDIQANETLVFTIDLISIVPGPDPAIVKAINDRGEPKPTVPDAPATKLIITDDVVGTGAAITPGATVVVHYVGVGQISKQTFDASWTRGEPAEFNVDQVIKGWSEGLIGMKVGGRRTLVIPGELAYGANPPDEAIKANETLVFVVDLVAIKA